jgi:mannose-6-phosphate isomerase-like protein (cupin superfamily)
MKTQTGFITNIEEQTLQNDNFRKVIFTAKHSQLVLMSLKPGEEIGAEVHEENDQFVRVEAGTGEVVLNGERTAVQDGSAVVVPAGVEHNVINTSKTEPLRLYTIYSPADHKDGTVHKTKADAEADPNEQH